MASTFLACPFCRELYEVREAEVCPVCGVALRGLGELPPSYEVQQQLAQEWEQTPPEDRRLPWTHWRNGRGSLALCSLFGLALFFAPWIDMSRPEELTLSGFDLAHAKGFWFAGGATAWLVNIPLVLSRRSINQMQGVRIVTTVFAALTACQGLLLLVASPAEDSARNLVPLSYHWAWGLYASIAVSVAATLLALRFGTGAPGRTGLDPATAGSAATSPAATSSLGDEPVSDVAVPTPSRRERLH